MGKPRDQEQYLVKIQRNAMTIIADNDYASSMYQYLCKSTWCFTYLYHSYFRCGELRLRGSEVFPGHTAHQGGQELRCWQLVTPGPTPKH